MKIGIIGLPQSGKTTIFSLLTGIDVDPYSPVHQKGVAKVYDKRVELLSNMYNPKKTTYATLEFYDTPSLDPSDKKSRTQVFNMVQSADALLLVLRAFENENVLFPEENAYKQLRIALDEFIFRDLEIVMNRIEKLENSKRKLDNREEIELKLLKELREVLENEEFLSKHELTEEQKKMISSYSLVTLRPIIIAINLDENQFTKGKYPEKERVLDLVKDYNFAYIELCGLMEKEIQELNEEERQEFLKDLGIEESGIERLSKVVYEQLGLISFFTVGPDEVRAWTLKKGSSAVEAAGVIHTDLARGFIKAEVIKYEDLINYGSEKEVKERGLMKLVGKDYIVEDGDILTIRFNV
ncbi:MULTISPECIES: redox-regulated ATPase YchF [unclassified Thermosipho (in: thermotogales)]|uniref:redox-regulated ATPase YchF n=1 Tax=unclassified Thermosipho (in: thermotogales) TaxID=2676525 RepID=UPI0009846232|nr:MULTISPECIES: redox-regulated ATPase YchF [unclassified Thermosipho (in: thermotogales)]MBT1248105.1 GTP-binding protein [Thermosipho sp. 1244]OOC46693.1 GTP-binding protein [Thermosipho sp. 1223]